MEIIKNKSSVFVQPLIDDVNNLYFSDSINWYINVEGEENDSLDFIYVAFLTKNLVSKYLLLEHSKKAIPNETRIHNLESSKHYERNFQMEAFTIYVYNTPKEHENDLWRFVEGEYSKLTKRAKNRIESCYAGSDKVKKILNPTVKDRLELASDLDVSNAEDIHELFDKPDIEQETFKLSHFLKLV